MLIREGQSLCCNKASTLCHRHEGDVPPQDVCSCIMLKRLLNKHGRLGKSEEGHVVHRSTKNEAKIRADEITGVSSQRMTVIG